MLKLGGSCTMFGDACWRKVMRVEKVLHWVLMLGAS